MPFTIPDFRTLGTGEAQSAGEPAPRPDDHVAGWDDAGATGAALQQVGKQAQDAGINLKNILDVADVNTAMATQFQPKLQAMASNFYSLQGKAAVDAAAGSDDTPAYGAQVEDLMHNVAGTLSGSAQEAFVNQAQHQVDNELYRAAMHAGQQKIVYAQQAHEAVQGNDLQEVTQALNGGDMPAAMDGVKRIQAREALYQNQLGNGPDSDISKAKINELNNKLFQSTFFSLPPAQQVPVGSALFPQWSPGATPPSKSPNIGAAILGQESNNNPNAPTSINGAVGKEQIMPATFAQYAKPGESIEDPAARAAVFGRMMDDYSQKYKGDAQRVAVAYFSGPGNVAPSGSATPWINDTKDGNGKSVASYVSDINNRLSSGQYADNSAVQSDAPGTLPSTASAITAPPSAAAASTRTFLGIPVDASLGPKIMEGAMANKEHADRLQKMSDESNFNQVQNDFFTKQHNNQLQWADIQKANLPVQGPGGKEWWEERINKTDKTDPAVFNDLMRRAQLPDGDQNKLTDPKELLGNVGHGITYGDMQHIQETMTGGDPGKEALKQFYKQGHDQLSKSTMTDIDGEGERRAYNWYMATSKAISDGQAKGLTMQQLIDPVSKDYVGNNITQYQEDLTTQTNNLAAKLRNAAPAAALPVDKQRQNGESADAYVKRLGL